MNNKPVQNRTAVSQAVMLEALKKTLGVVQPACDQSGVSRTQHYIWIKEHPEYAAAVDEITEIAVDFVETQLYKKISKQDTQSILFYLRTKGRKRGYQEKVENENHNYEHQSIYEKIEPAPNDL